MKLITYLINLDGSDERLSSAQVQLEQQGITFTRVSAFDGRGLNLAEVSDYDEAHALRYMGRKLKGGELWCYYSHLDCARRFLASEVMYALVLEDDMHLTGDIMPTLEQHVSWLQANAPDWHLLHIAANKRKIYTTINQWQGSELMHAHYFPMTTTALVWSRAGAQAFIDAHSKIFAPVDNYFRWWLTRSDKGYSVWPTLVTTTGADSDIDTRQAQRKVAGRVKFYGLIKQHRLWSDKIIALYHKYSRYTE